MARIKLSSYLQSISGRMGDIVLYNSRGREYARVYVKPANPDTEEQKIVRKTFRDAVKSWQELSLEEKHKYNIKAHRLPMSGYNLYISIYMKENISLTDKRRDKTSRFMVSSMPDHSIQKAGSSAASPFDINDCLYSPFIQVIHGSGTG